MEACALSLLHIARLMREELPPNGAVCGVALPIHSMPCDVMQQFDLLFFFSSPFWPGTLDMPNNHCIDIYEIKNYPVQTDWKAAGHTSVLVYSCP